MNVRKVYPIGDSKPVIETPPVAQDWESHRNDSIIIDNGKVLFHLYSFILLSAK